MRAIVACFAALFLTAFGSGCTEPSPAADADGEDAGRTSVAADSGPDVVEAEFGWLAAVEAPVVGNAQLEARNAASLDVSEGRSVLVTEVTWDCATDPCDLHLYLCSPEDDLADCSEHALGPSPLSIEVSDPMPGEWRLGIFASGANAEVSGTVAMTAA